jgi:adenylate cyclase
MNTHEASSSGQAPARRLQFDRYVLDLSRGCLLREGVEITLRPKTFAVLCYLVEHAGRLVPKEEFFSAVWPNLVVTDDVLVQSVGELRRVLGEDGSRLIKTIPRRGYRFETPASPVSSAPVTGLMPDSDFLHAAPAPPRSSNLHRNFLAGLALATLAVAAIWWASGGNDGSKAEGIAPRVIAILPFQNQSNDPGREYFADGLTQDIINALGRFPELTVISWNAVSPYKGKQATPGELARNLAVNYQVEGSVLRAGDRLRVIAQLVDVSGHVLWAARFDEPLTDLFALQGRITTEIAGALAIRVRNAEQQRALAKPAESLEAYDYVLRARPALQRPARANLVEARALLRRAIQVDPDCAACYAALADTFYVAVAMGWAESPNEYLDRAEGLANKALSLSDAQIRAHVTLGRIHLFYHRYEQAIAEMDRAIVLNSSDAQSLAGRGNVLMWLGETDAAIEFLEQAQRIDPSLSAIDRYALSLAYYLKQRYGAAVEQAEINLRETADANYSRIVLAAAYAQQNRVEETARVTQLIRRLDPTFEPMAFGNKFLKPADLEHLREGFRKAGLLANSGAALPPS